MKIAIHAFEGSACSTSPFPRRLLRGGTTRARPVMGHAVWSTEERVTTSEGVKVADLRGPEAAAGADLLVFPSWHADLRDGDADVSTAIRDAARRGAALAGLCLGAFPLPAQACSTDARSSPTGAPPRTSRPDTRRCWSTPTRSTSTTRRADLRWDRLLSRRVLAHRAPRARLRGSSDLGPAPRRRSAPRRRAGAVRRPADAGAGRSRADRGDDRWALAHLGQRIEVDARWRRMLG